MSKIVSLSVNVDKIDKTKLVKGEKGTYLNLTLNINDEKDNLIMMVECGKVKQKKKEKLKQIETT